jgi:site-specific recombinase XerC
MNPIAAHRKHLEYLNRRPTSVRQRVLTLERVERFAGMQLLEITDGEILQGFVNQESLGVEARAAAVSHLRGFYRWALDEALAAADPSTRLRRPKRERRMPRPMPDDAAALALGEAPSPIREWLFLAAYAGLRACEIAQLRGKDFLTRQRPPILIVGSGSV